LPHHFIQRRAAARLASRLQQWHRRAAVRLVAVLLGSFNAAQALVLAKGIAIVCWRAARDNAHLRALHSILNKVGDWMSWRGINKVMSNHHHVFLVVMFPALTVLTNVASNPLLQKATGLDIGDNTTTAN